MSIEEYEKKRRNEQTEEQYNRFKKEIKKVMRENSENWEDVIYCSVNKKDFEHGFAYSLPLFKLWTKDYVYFHVESRGYCWVNSVLRNPPEEN